MRTLKLAWVFFRICLMNEAAYRANFFIQVFESALGMVTAIGSVFIVFDQTDQLAGWHRSELISLLGIYFIILGSINLMVAPSLTKFMEDIVEGKLDFTITKPRDSQLLVSIQEFRIWKLLDIVMGLIVLFVGIGERATETNWLDASLFLASLATAGAIIYSFWIILATFAFWFIRVENILQIFWAMYIAGRWPVTIYPAWLKFILTAIVPIAFAVTVPAEAMAGKMETQTLLIAVGLAMALMYGSRKFWKFGIRFYSGASA
ncbi:MAG: ABC-2 family transporter protein [Pseudomonadales bacterium]|nr:ABC-2 family transporter protein [Pseudomonadales bacterium]